MRELDFWDPFREMKRARRMLDNWFTNLPIEFKGTSIRQPLIDISDKGKELELVAELPGVKKEDIEVNIDEQSVEIRAKSETETKEEKKNYYFHERSYESFQRRMPLPVEVLPDKAEAEFKNGILTITIPKKEPEHEKKGFRVQVK